MADALDWLLKNDPSYDLDDSSLAALASVSNVLLPRVTRIFDRDLRLVKDKI
jgi:hypothetical protein